MHKALALFLLAGSAFAQSLGNAGTIEGTVVDQSGALVPKATVTLTNAITGYKQTIASGDDGAFRLTNIPPNTYHLEVKASGFSTFKQEVVVRTSVPMSLKAVLPVAAAETTVNVEASGAAVVETDPSAHVDVDRSAFGRLPETSPGGGLADAIVYSTGAVSNDANGGFHPSGDHAQVSYLIDGQLISDQQSKIFSTSLPTSAIQSMELITGSPGAEFGDKTSLVAQVTTRSGLGSGKVFGNVESSYGSFGTVGGGFGLGFGSAKIGNFLAVDGVRSGRFLDTPEFVPYHAIGQNQTIFDRLDYQPTGKDVFHLNLFAARNWIQIPNDLDQLAQDQRQRVLTWNIAPGYQHTINSHTLLTINPYIRKDQFNYYGSRDVLADQPATQNQQRQLAELGDQGRRIHHSGASQHQVRRRSKADPPARKLRIRHHRPHVQLALPRFFGRAGGRYRAHQSHAVREPRVSGQHCGQRRCDAVRPGPAALRSDPRRADVRISRRRQHQSVRRLCAGFDDLRPPEHQYRLPSGPLRRAGVEVRSAAARGTRL